MHYHCEIVIPPDVEIEPTIARVMKPFCEQGASEESDDDEDVDRSHAFWDWYVIGGRFAGNKMLTGLDQQKLDEFYEWCKTEKITVAGLQCGKQEISPASQIPKVDAKWNEMFPSNGPPVPCPIFAHSNDQYGREGKGMIAGDVCLLRDALAVKCGRVIFTRPGWEANTKDFTGPPVVDFMLCEDQWNGCNHMPIQWDGTVGDALRQYKESRKGRNDFSAIDEWLIVTVDYHS